jgi:alkanesulfonate monooxygenase
MSELAFHWFLPTYGDSRDIVGGGHGVAVGAAGGARPASVAYLGQIARTAEQMASTFQRLSNGRLLLNVVTGGESAEQRAFGDFLDKDARYARCDEFLHVVRALWRGETVSHEGRYVHVEGARLSRLPDPVPAVYFAGSSAAAPPVAVNHSDVYLTWGEPPAQVAQKLDRVRELVADAGRTIRFGIRLHVIARDTAEDAWAQATRLLKGIRDSDIASVQAGLKRNESEGQRRMLELNGGSRDGLSPSWPSADCGSTRTRDTPRRSPPACRSPRPPS